MLGESNLPAGLHRKICYPHPVWSATRARGNTLVRRKILVAGAGSAGKLDNEAFTHEVGAICSLIRGLSDEAGSANTYGMLQSR
jgi:hypothetical protein